MPLTNVAPLYMPLIGEVIPERRATLWHDKPRTALQNRQRVVYFQTVSPINLENPECECRAHSHDQLPIIRRSTILKVFEINAVRIRTTNFLSFPRRIFVRPLLHMPCAFARPTSYHSPEEYRLTPKGLMPCAFAQPTSYHQI